MNHYEPLKDISIFVNTTDDNFITAKHTSHHRVKVSMGYSSTFTYVSNYQASNHNQPERAYVYIDELIEMYTKLRDKKHTDGINWNSIHQESINRLESYKALNWHYLGQRG